MTKRPNLKFQIGALSYLIPLSSRRGVRGEVLFYFFKIHISYIALSVSTLALIAADCGTRRLSKNSTKTGLEKIWARLKQVTKKY
jgi:hypothetical protein